MFWEIGGSDHRTLRQPGCVPDGLNARPPKTNATWTHLWMKSDNVDTLLSSPHLGLESFFETMLRVSLHGIQAQRPRLWLPSSFLSHCSQLRMARHHRATCLTRSMTYLDVIDLEFDKCLNTTFVEVTPFELAVIKIEAG